MITELPTTRSIVSDFLIIGGGAAGLDLALRLAEFGEVVLLTKTAAGQSNSYHAQGGIAAVLDPEDQYGDHVQDTLAAGAGLCRPDIVRFVVENGSQAIGRLIALGVSFTKDKNGYHLTREGGHSTRRVIHTADATGKAVVQTLLNLVAHHPRIRMMTHQIAIDFITAHKLGHYLPGRRNRCFGCHVLDNTTGQINTFQAKFTILASGGAGKVYLYTSNPDEATGDGIAMAWRAGCRVANMEFIQFHPTCLFHPQAKSFLISEAVRGEGGILRLQNGDEFMLRHHERRELAPRDSVARAIDFEMKRTGEPCVYLDISHKGRDFLTDHFPNILEKCASLDIDITQEPIPVVPAAHYTCGGVVTNQEGKTDLDGLYAIGEVSCTGLHGANRLASNSLLECLVFSEAASLSIAKNIQNQPKITSPSLPLWDSFDTKKCTESILIAHTWDEIRRCMWNYVGIVRSNQRLDRARRRIDMIKNEIHEDYWNCRLTRDLLELRNLATIASLIIRCAIHRKESRGLHYNINYPQTDDRNWHFII
ncbi:MAG: L-aspartate oxidase [Magnetococcus sp. DMHC-6]